MSHSIPADIEKLKHDTVNTVYNQLERYKDALDPMEYEMHHDELSFLSEHFDLPEPAANEVKSAKMLDHSIADRSFAEYYFGR